jgi:CRISPR/Cas system-associated exonuclease Cas4 (RecB family)
MGWDLESLHMKDSLMIQPIHYKLLAEKSLGKIDIPFYFFVFSSTDVNNVKIIKVEVDESKKQSHVVALNNIKGRLLTDKFIPHPSIQRCSKCPLSYKCQHKVEFPLVDEVFY